MATYGGGLKIVAAVAISTSVGASLTTLFTCPAGEYAVVQVYGSGNAGNSMGIDVGGVPVGAIQATSGGTITGIFVGPGQSVQASYAFGTASVSVSGVTFSN